MSAEVSKPRQELTRLGETIAFAAAVLGLVFLAFLTVMVVEAAWFARGLTLNPTRLVILAAVFTGVAFACGVLVQFPLLNLLRLVTNRRAVGIAAGALLGLLPVILLLLVFRDADGSRTLEGHLAFLRRAPVEVLLDLLPYIGSGAAVGWLTWMPRGKVPPA